MTGRPPTLEEVAKLAADAWLAANGAERPSYVGESRTKIRTLEARYAFRAKYPALAGLYPPSEDPVVIFDAPDINSNSYGRYQWLPGDPAELAPSELAPSTKRYGYRRNETAAWVATHPERRMGNSDRR